MRKSNVFISVILTMLSFLWFAPTNVAQASNNDPPCQLILGWHLWPPFQYLDDTNQAVGLQIDLIKKLEIETNCKIQLRQQTFVASQQDIKNGDIDLTFDITITEARKEFGYFSVPYRKELLVLYVKPDYYEECLQQDLVSLIKNGFRLSITKGIDYGRTITEIKNNPELNKLLHYQDDSKVELDMFRENKVDGILEDPIVMAYMKRNDRKLTFVESCQATVYGRFVSIMFSKKTVPKEIVDKFNKAINHLKQDAEYVEFWGLH